MSYTGSVPDTERAADWREKAVCSTPAYAKQRDLWFPTPGDTSTAREAKEVCWTCPVIYLCRAWSFEHGEDVGVWGGMTEAERRRIHRRPAKKKTAGDGFSAPGRRRRAA